MMTIARASALLGMLLTVAIGCGSDFESDGAAGGSGAGGSAGTGASAGSAGAGAGGSAGSAGTGATGGSAGSAGGAGAAGVAGAGGGTVPEVRVVLRATTEAYAHDDGLASQTAQMVSAGVRSFELIDGNDEHWSVMDASPSNVVVGYDDGNATELARLEPATVPAGHYVTGRLVQDWSKFEVKATLHELAGATDGVLRVLQATSEGAMFEGEPMSLGQFEHEFEAPGRLEHYDGTYEIPDYSATAEAEAYLEEGLWAVYFPIDLDLTSGEGGTIEIEVNMDRAFRWEDVPTLGNEADVYDIAPPLYEPVEQFGGNRFVVRWLPD